MIRELRVSNFRSLGKDVRLPLGQLTVLAGRNGSGKSNAIDVLQFLADAMHLGLEGAITKRHGIRAVRRWQRSGYPHDVKLAVDVSLDEGVQGTYDIVLGGAKVEDYHVKREHLVITGGGQEVREVLVESGQWKKGPDGLQPKTTPLSLALPLIAGDERFRAFADALRGIACYTIFPDHLRAPQEYDPTRPMDRNGKNWVSILKDQPAESWKPDLVTVLQHLTGDITDVHVKPAGGYLTVQFEHGNGAARAKRKKVFESAQESDGTLRVAGIVTALLQRPPPTLVALEEPELTVHPGALALLMDYVEEASRRTQVVLTTHSPDLLDHVDVESVLVVERHEGETSIARVEPGQRKVVQEGLLALGEVHRSEGLQSCLEFGGRDG